METDRQLIVVGINVHTTYVCIFCWIYSFNLCKIIKILLLFAIKNTIFFLSFFHYFIELFFVSFFFFFQKNIWCNFITELHRINRLVDIYRRLYVYLWRCGMERHWYGWKCWKSISFWIARAFVCVSISSSPSICRLHFIHFLNDFYDN